MALSTFLYEETLLIYPYLSSFFFFFLLLSVLFFQINCRHVPRIKVKGTKNENVSSGRKKRNPYVCIYV